MSERGEIPWCSTRTSSNGYHIRNSRNEGNCPKNGEKCPQQMSRFDIKIHSGDYYKGKGHVRNTFSPEKLLIWNRPETYVLPPGIANYWLAPNRKTNVGFTLELPVVTRITKIFMVNTHNGFMLKRATKEFKVFLSMNPNGPWTEVLNDELPNDSGVDCDVSPKTFTIKHTNAKFVKFLLVSYWGYGGGLQYFTVLDSDEEPTPNEGKS